MTQNTATEPRDVKAYREHLAAAEGLLANPDANVARLGFMTTADEQAVALAQVHATLAVAAATRCAADRP